jgi:hypothetical protein
MKALANRIALIMSLLILTSVTVTSAQDSTRIRPFHISLITPLGTNGLESWNITNRISINLIAGFSGGLQGVEWAGFANATKGQMNGIQIAGFCNNTFGGANGLEIAGFWNYNQKGLKGMQLSGFANVALDSVDGIQGAGFSNLTVGDTRGIQASGFANVTTGRHTGLQAAGFANVARRLNGVQVGVINIADTVEKGIPIGFLSFVRHGYKVIQVGGNETLYGEISFKTGVRRFYNIFSVGSTFTNNDWKWGWGYGIGTLIPVGKRMDISIEGVSYMIKDDEWFNWEFNSLNRLNIALSYNVTRNIGVYAGGSWNVLVSGNEAFDDWHHHYRNVVSTYPGFMAGVRFGM